MFIQLLILSFLKEPPVLYSTLFFIGFQGKILLFTELLYYEDDI